MPVRLRPVPKEQPDVTPIEDAATEFGVGRTTLYRWMAAGKLTRYERPGGRPRVYVDRREIRRLLEPKPTPKKR